MHMASEGGGGKPFEKRDFWQRWLLFWTADGATALQKWINDWEVEPILFATALFLFELWWMLAYDPSAVAGVLAVVVAISPIWLPIYLFNFFWTTWMHYIRFAFWFTQKHILLRIELPPEVSKSPLAMEVFLAALYQTGGESDFISRIWGGKFRAHWSLEIVSNEGKIDFYLYLRAAWRNVIEAKLYGQYPEAKITEVPDYVDDLNYADITGLWGCEFKKNDAAVPIRTYIDYQLDKNPDSPETQVDPITNVLEHLGSIGPGEYLWLQIIIQAHRKDEWYGFPLVKDSFDSAVQDKLKKITEAAIKRAQDLVSDDAEKKKVGSRGSTLLSPGEREQVEAIERGKTKLPFDVGMRGLYIGKGAFNANNIGNLTTIFNPYRYPTYAAVVPARGLTLFTYPWQKEWLGFIGKMREEKIKKNLFFHYKHRAFFNVPYDQVPTYMNTEELATLWHFPSSAVKTPALSRVPSRRAEAPANLPTGNFVLPR